MFINQQKVIQTIAQVYTVNHSIDSVQSDIQGFLMKIKQHAEFTRMIAVQNQKEMMIEKHSKSLEEWTNNLIVNTRVFSNQSISFLRGYCDFGGSSHHMFRLSTRVIERGHSLKSHCLNIKTAALAGDFKILKESTVSGGRKLELLFRSNGDRWKIVGVYQSNHTFVLLTTHII